MNVLFILNDQPNEAGRSVNALPLACSLSMRSSVYVRIFLVGAAVACARGQSESRAHSGDAEAMVKAVIRRGGEVRVCGICAEEDEECQRDVCVADLIAGTSQSSLTDLSPWVAEADRLLVF